MEGRFRQREQTDRLNAKEGMEGRFRQREQRGKGEANIKGAD